MDRVVCKRIHGGTRKWGRHGGNGVLFAVELAFVPGSGGGGGGGGLFFFFFFFFFGKESDGIRCGLVVCVV